MANAGLIGQTRNLYTQQKISAQEPKALGVVAEVLPTNEGKSLFPEYFLRKEASCNELTAQLKKALYLDMISLRATVPVGVFNRMKYRPVFKVCPSTACR